MPGNYPKESIIHIKHGESLKSRIHDNLLSHVHAPLNKPLLSPKQTCFWSGYAVNSDCIYCVLCIHGPTACILPLCHAQTCKAGAARGDISNHSAILRILKSKDLDTGMFFI